MILLYTFVNSRRWSWPVVSWAVAPRQEFHCFAESAGVYYTAGKHRSSSAKSVRARQRSATWMWKAAHARRNCIVDYSLLINQLLLCKGDCSTGV